MTERATATTNTFIDYFEHSLRVNTWRIFNYMIPNHWFGLFWIKYPIKNWIDGPEILFVCESFDVATRHWMNKTKLTPNHHTTPQKLTHQSEHWSIKKRAASIIVLVHFTNVFFHSIIMMNVFCWILFGSTFTRSTNIKILFSLKCPKMVFFMF